MKIANAKIYTLVLVEGMRRWDVPKMEGALLSGEEYEFAYSYVEMAQETDLCRIRFEAIPPTNGHIVVMWSERKDKQG